MSGVTRRLVAGLAGALLLGACASPASRGVTSETETTRQLRPRQIIVAIDLVTPELRQRVARTLARSYGLRLAGAFPLPSISVHCVVFELQQDQDVDAVVAQLVRHPSVRLAQRNQRFEVDQAPDAQGPQADAGSRSDPYAGFQYGAERVRAAEAHGWSTGDGVRIAVIDTGVDRGHPDFGGRVFASGTFIDDDAHFDSDAHGTSVVGVLVAQPDNGEGIYGMAPGAEILAAKACRHTDEGRALCSSWSIARAVDHALTEQVDVINLSLGGPPDPLLEVLLRAADEAGVVVIAAAGDDGAMRFPAAYETVIAAIASGPEGEVPLHRGAKKARRVSAPGRDIITTAPGGGYHFLSGSSLSTAYVSGAAALLIAFQGDLSPGRVAELLSAPVASASLELDACRALQRVSDGRVCREP